jgi:hypothetical protein
MTMRYQQSVASRYEAATVRFQASSIVLYGGTLLARLFIPHDAQERVLDSLTQNYVEASRQFGWETLDYFLS